MRAFSLAIVGLLASVASSSASSFHTDVVSRGDARRHLKKHHERTLNDQLLEKAVPVQDYEKKFGVSLSDRKLDENNFEFDYNNMYSFEGFSLTYAKCQPIQYFSEEAVEMGSTSPMAVDDIVVLRLCPEESCSDSKEYGCYSNFAEYALSLKDYLTIMLNFEIIKVQYMCEYCDGCLNGNGRRMEEEQQQDEQNENENQDNQQDNNYNDNNQQQQNQYNYNNNNNQQQNGNNNNQGNAYDDQFANQYACSGWGTFCSDYGSKCNNNGQVNGNYLDYEGYLNYLECSQTNNQNNGNIYYIKPRCDGTHNTIKMTAHYDQNCMESLPDMSAKNFGLGMTDNAFRNFYSGECLSCDDSDFPPYDAPSIMCNMIHYNSAQCVEKLAYDPFEMDDSAECSFIESIRAGTYDETGTILLRSFGFTGEKITTAQKLFLTVFVSLTVGLTVYACYLHHAMTNLLIKSLSHRELLPPSRHASRRSSPRRTGRRLKKVGAESDWDDSEFA